jgi:hypothetical protein
MFCESDMKSEEKYSSILKLMDLRAENLTQKHLNSQP